ncbi:hypothetical protein [Ammoniphilus sp. 3BR4]
MHFIFEFIIGLIVRVFVEIILERILYGIFRLLRFLYTLLKKPFV